MTDRRFDEATETGRRLYIKCANLLAVARDHQLALEDMVKVAIRPCASWSLIRPAFEASFYVIWALEPDDAIERRRRGLRLAWDEWKSRKNRHAAEFAVGVFADEQRSAASEAHLKELKDKYEREARELHMGDKLLGQNINLVDCLPKLESVKGGGLDGKYYALVWRGAVRTRARRHGGVGRGVGCREEAENTGRMARADDSQRPGIQRVVPGIDVHAADGAQSVHHEDDAALGVTSGR